MPQCRSGFHAAISSTLLSVNSATRSVDDIAETFGEATIRKRHVVALDRGVEATPTFPKASSSGTWSLPWLPLVAIPVALGKPVKPLAAEDDQEHYLENHPDVVPVPVFIELPA